MHIMKFMEKIIELYKTDITNQDFSCDDDHELWLFIQDNLLYDDDDEHNDDGDDHDVDEIDKNK